MVIVTSNGKIMYGTVCQTLLHPAQAKAANEFLAKWFIWYGNQKQVIARNSPESQERHTTACTEVREELEAYDRGETK